MQTSFEYPVQFPDDSEKIIEFEASITNGGFSHDWHGGGFESYLEIDDIEYDSTGLTKEESKFIEDKILDSGKLLDKIWDSYENS